MSTRCSPRSLLFIVFAALVAGPFALAACGGDDDAMGDDEFLMMLRSAPPEARVHLAGMEGASTSRKRRALLWAEAEKQRAEQQLLRSEGLLYAIQIASALHEWETNNVSLAWTHLDACRGDLRGWEYDYLYALFNQNQRTLRAHKNAVHAVAFSPDGQRIVSSGGDGLKVWDAANGQESITISGGVGHPRPSTLFLVPSGHMSALVGQ